MKIDLRTEEGQQVLAELGVSFEVLDLTRGRWLTHVFFVDEEAGICRRYKTVGEGWQAALAIGPDLSYIQEELRGRFKIVSKDPVRDDGEGRPPCGS